MGTEDRDRSYFKRKRDDFQCDEYPFYIGLSSESSAIHTRISSHCNALIVRIKLKLERKIILK